MQFQPVTDLQLLIDFCLAYGWPEAWPLDVINSIMTHQISSTDLLFDVHGDDGARLAVAVLVDKTANKENHANLDVMGMALRDQATEIYDTLLAQAIQKLPAGFDRLRVSFPDLFQYNGLVKKYRLRHYFDTHEMQAENRSFAPDPRWPFSALSSDDYREFYDVMRECCRDNDDISFTPFEDWHNARGTMNVLSWVLKQNDKIVAFITIAPPEKTDDPAEIRLLGVLPALRGRGNCQGYAATCDDLLSQSEHSTILAVCDRTKPFGAVALSIRRVHQNQTICQLPLGKIMSISETIRFECDGEVLVGTIDWNAAKDKPTVISMHGGGPSGKYRTAYLCQALAANGHSCIRFDHAGQGESPGDMKNQTLNKRTAHALAAAQRFMAKDKPLTVIGTSMAGHTALDLLSHLNVGTLILFCPAAYDAAAHDVPFDDRFSAILRQPESFKRATLFGNLHTYTGKFLHVIGDQDAVIPPGVTELYKQHSRHLTSRDFVVMPGCGHKLHQAFEENDAEKQVIIQRILALL